jgi:hypothetical protein
LGIYSHIMETIHVENILWSDESHFCLRNPGCPHIWCQPHEKYDINCLIPTVKHGQVSVMVWGCFSWFGLGPLVIVTGTIISVKCQAILEENLVLFLNDIKKRKKCKLNFQEDNVCPHTSKSMRKWRGSMTSLSCCGHHSLQISIQSNIFGIALSMPYEPDPTIQLMLRILKMH